MNVQYVDHMGDDLTVVNAARVSMDKHHDVFDHKTDAGLIDYLARSQPPHWTPFAHAIIQFRITCALFVAAQLKRHCVGAAVNEVSRRYVSARPTFEPLVWRRKAPNVKQGSAGEFPEQDQTDLAAVALKAQTACLNAYIELLDKGVAPEQARAVLPQTTHTSWYWTGSLFFFGRLCSQRLEGHAQKECRDVARAISDRIAPRFPVAWGALLKYLTRTPDTP